MTGGGEERQILVDWEIDASKMLCAVKYKERGEELLCTLVFFFHLFRGVSTEESKSKNKNKNKS